MSSYDPLPDEVITPEQFRQSMKLVRLQIAVPISVLVAMGTNLVCALALKPGLSGISALFPTLLTPNSIMIELYWAVLFGLQIGFCLVLLLARKEATKEMLVHGVGLRFAVANWLQAAWAVFFTLQFFIGAEVVLLINALNVLSIHMTLLYYPPTLKRPMDAIFIHAPMTMFLAILFQLDWLHSGFIAVGWIIKDESKWGKYTWQAVACVASVNIVSALWAGARRLYLLTIASMYLLFSLLFSSPRTNPTLPTTALPKPPPLLITIIACLVLHPITLIVGVAWKRSLERQGRIRLEEDVERVEGRREREERERA
ncbi:hypothetical protein J008_00882 [Cryptococcus neoformans]|nr:hypothetical protein C362_00609 [Cryptococcus neoformans var. grubii Bt1]OWZ61936.1 hypothetical protein AYX15_05878 [Cryptococcus neoformans var. grubii]OWZ80475.1 hypothetical protein C365_00947 [Cryptococcus neoformans var. grubii Bt85]OXG22565.1 hypothetical protein C366_00882 [Cryptococcus neoformans var. grubii Tu401-1]OXG33173.1 hypothetical protein C367_00894 [Cryptococcus neoformans var. grubii Ze90-1]OXM81334.1 hypothetical protein C364_00886 [Cryptococcus neoformans var. grubii B